MPSVTYLSDNGERTQIELSNGTSLMAGAVANDIQGIVGECGGSAMCATCHVYIDEAWLSALPPPDEVEEEMLESVMAERKPTSRLSCQIFMSAELDGLVLQVPERQS